MNLQGPTGNSTPDTMLPYLKGHTPVYLTIPKITSLSNEAVLCR